MAETRRIKLKTFQEATPEDLDDAFATWRDALPDGADVVDTHGYAVGTEHALQVLYAGGGD